MKLMTYVTIIAVFIIYNTCINADILLHSLYPQPGSVEPPSAIVQAVAESYNISSIEESKTIMQVNGFTVTNLRISGSTTIQTLTYIPESTFTPGSTVSVYIHVEDNAANVAETNYTFTVQTDTEPPVFVYTAPSTYSNNVKICSIEAIAQDNSLMSNHVDLIVDGVAVTPNTVDFKGNSISVDWTSELMPIGAYWPVHLIVYDEYANAATASWIFVSTTTSDDFRDLAFDELAPAPQASEIISLAPISASVFTRIDHEITNVTMTVNGRVVDTYITGSAYEKTVIYIPNAPYQLGSIVDVQVTANDGYDTAVTSWWFQVGEFSDSGEKGFVLLNLWPLYAGDTQDIHIAWAHMRAGVVRISSGTNILYEEHHLPSQNIYSYTIAPSNRAALGIPERGSNILDVTYFYENVTQESQYVHYTVDDLAVFQKGTKGYTGTADLDGDFLAIKYKSKAGDTPVVQGRTIIVEGGAKAALSLKVKSPKSGGSDGKYFIDTIHAKNGLKKLMSKGASIGEIKTTEGGIRAIKILGELGRENIVAVEEDQVNGLEVDFAKAIIVQGGNVYGDIIIKGDPAQKPPKIFCKAKKNKMTKEFEGGTFYNTCIRTEDTDIAQIAAQGGAGFVYEPDVYRIFRLYGSVLAGISTNFVPQGQCSNMAPANVIQKVKIKNGRMMGSWLSERGAKQKIKCYEPLREDVWFIDGEMKPQWDGEE